MSERIEKHDGFEQVWGLEDNGFYYEEWATRDDGSRDFLIRRDVTTIAESLSLMFGVDNKVEAQAGGEIVLTMKDGQQITLLVSPSGTMET